MYQLCKWVLGLHTVSFSKEQHSLKWCTLFSECGSSAKDVPLRARTLWDLRPLWVNSPRMARLKIAQGTEVRLHRLEKGVSVFAPLPDRASCLRGRATAFSRAPVPRYGMCAMWWEFAACIQGFCCCFLSTQCNITYSVFDFAVSLNHLSCFSLPNERATRARSRQSADILHLIISDPPCT